MCRLIVKEDMGLEDAEDFALVGTSKEKRIVCINTLALESFECPCSFVSRIDPVDLTLPPCPGERRHPVVRPLKPQFF